MMTPMTSNGTDAVTSTIPALQAELSRVALATAEATAALQRARGEQRKAQARLNAAVAAEAQEQPLWEWVRRSAGPTAREAEASCRLDGETHVIEPALEKLLEAEAEEDAWAGDPITADREREELADRLIESSGKAAPKKQRKPKPPPIPPDSEAAQFVHKHLCPKGPQEPLPDDTPAASVTAPLPESVPGYRTQFYEQLFERPDCRDGEAADVARRLIAEFHAAQQTGWDGPAWDTWSEWHLPLLTLPDSRSVEALWRPDVGQLELWCVGHAPASRFVQPAARLGSLDDYAQSFAKVVFKKGRKKKGG